MTTPTTDREFADRFAALEKAVKESQVSPQPYLGDWRNLSPSEYSYTSTTEIGITAFDPISQFNVGDKLRWKQTGDSSYRYAYISKINSASVEIFAGDDYSVANLDFIEISVSDKANPTDFPPKFSYQPSIVSDGSPTSVTITGGTETLYVNMDGNLVKVTGQLSWSTLSTTRPTQFFISMPFSVATTVPFNQIVNDGFAVTNLTTLKSLAVRLKPDTDNDDFIVKPPGNTAETFDPVAGVNTVVVFVYILYNVD